MIDTRYERENEWTILWMRESRRTRDALVPKSKLKKEDKGFITKLYNAKEISGGGTGMSGQGAEGACQNQSRSLKYDRLG